MHNVAKALIPPVSVKKSTHKPNKKANVKKEKRFSFIGYEKIKAIYKYGFA